MSEKSRVGEFRVWVKALSARWMPPDHRMKRRALQPSMMRLLRQAHPELSFQTLQVLMHFMTVPEEEDSGDAATGEESDGRPDGGVDGRDGRSSPPFEDLPESEDRDEHISRIVDRLLAVRAASQSSETKH